MAVMQALLVAEQLGAAAAAALSDKTLRQINIAAADGWGDSFGLHFSHWPNKALRGGANGNPEQGGYETTSCGKQRASLVLIKWQECQ
jgi:hypothetical protein